MTNVILAPRNLAVVIFFYVFLSLFKICLILMIYINSVTFRNFEFNYRAIELLHTTKILLNLKGVR
jgi:hypothetical protein